MRPLVEAQFYCLLSTMQYTVLLIKTEEVGQMMCVCLGMQAGWEALRKAKLPTLSTDEVFRRARAAADSGKIFQGTITSANAAGLLVRLDSGIFGACKLQLRLWPLVFCMQ